MTRRSTWYNPHVVTRSPDRRRAISMCAARDRDGGADRRRRLYPRAPRRSLPNASSSSASTAWTHSWWSSTSPTARCRTSQRSQRRVAASTDWARRCRPIRRRRGASFATGVNPGEHNIFDTHVRDPATYQARPGLMERQPGRFLLNYFPVAPPLIRSVRDGTSFWVTAGRAGVRSSILAVPVTFPPKPVPNGELLSGVPLPDLRGTDGTYSYFATDLEAGEEGLTQFGGVLARLTLTDGVAAAELVGPPDPTVAARAHDAPREGGRGDGARTAAPRRARRRRAPARADDHTLEPGSPGPSHRDGRAARSIDPPSGGGMEPVDRAGVSRQSVRAAARHDAAVSGRRDRRGAAVRRADPVASRGTAAAGLGAAPIRRRPGRAPRDVRHDGMGRGNRSAPRRAPRRTRVSRRPGPRLRRSRGHDPEPARPPRLELAGRGH